MNGAMHLIRDDLNLVDVQMGFLAGILNICAIVGSLLAGRTSDYIGRRYTIVGASVLFCLGSVLMGYGPNYPVLMIGRGTAGVGVGFALTIAPVYATEISPASSRGLLSSLTELSISIGILLGYLSNFAFSRLTLRLGWRLMLGIAAIPSVGLMFGVLRMPESPRWLAMQGKLKSAENVIFKVSDSAEEAQIRFDEIKSSLVGCTDELGGSVWKDLLHPTPPVRRMLIAAVGIHFFEHATGIEAITLYSLVIFGKAGITEGRGRLLATLGIGVTKFVFIFIATMILDRLGRRRLVLISVGGMIVALISLGLGLTMAEQSDGKLWAFVLSIGSTYIYVAFFNIGLAPVSWVYSSEIFPSRLRAQGHSIGVTVNRVMTAAISMSFIPLYKAITIGGTFFLFGGISLVGWMFFFYLPETKGRTLGEMEEVFGKKIPKPSEAREEIPPDGSADV